MFRRVGGAVRRFARSGIGRTLGGVLRNVARRALPIAGAALGGVVGGPLGAKIGGKLAGFAGKAFGLELEGLSAEDREFEVARAYVRFAHGAARRAARLSRTGLAPRVIVRRAVFGAARRYAPGLLVPTGVVTRPVYTSGPVTSAVSARGRWVRRGNRIILFNV
ncbi:MAG: hypothetical protein L6Q97_06405 [Thermoanaerobaculia bacterium]|nr:hypothetical protein [Thermoanaerobaculia bacterium]